MKTQNPTVGLLAVIAVWLVSAISLTWVKNLEGFSAAEIIFWRGLTTMIMAFLCYRAEVGIADKYMPGYTIGFAFAALGAYKSIKYWGVNPTVIILAMTPTINFALSLLMGHKIPRFAFLGFIVMTLGISLSLRPEQWHSGVNGKGLLWALIATLGCGIGNECLGHTKDTTRNQIFWMGLVMAAVSFLDLCVDSKSLPRFHISGDNALKIFLFAFSVGWVYLQMYILSFKHLHRITASVILQGETLVVVVAATLFAGEKMLVLQWAGVAVVLIGVVLTKLDAGKNK